jgi:4-hydroxybenzoate polyprenyltransferase
MASHAVFSLLMTAIGFWQSAGCFYTRNRAGGITGCLSVLPHQRPQREACFKAFLNNTWVGCAIFVGLGRRPFPAHQILVSAHYSDCAAFSSGSKQVGS